MTTIYPDLRPNVFNVRAIITTRWGNSGYRPLVVPKIESYYVDTALDSDADTWTCDIGDPNGDLLEMLDRDNEVRVQLFGVGTEGTNYVVTGLADEISYDEEGTMTVTGRDMSSLATDSTVRPSQFRHVRAWAIVEEQAKDIGFRATNLARSGIIKKLQQTDGSESYWEFWWRLYRKEKMWIWTDPDGTLIAGRLNYENAPSYYLGWPQDNDTEYIKRLYIPIERCEIRKTTQTRVAEVWVYGHKGDNGFLSIAKDPTISNWIKKPRRVLLDTDSHTIKGAQKTGWEEIFEGKVGSREIKVTIPDPGFPIKQNRMAHIRLPEIGLEGTYFVIGVRLQGSSQGFVQEIRLREKNLAMSRRIPKEPKIVTHTPGASTSAGLGSEIAGVGNMPEAWGQYFVKAAKQWHGPWDFRLFLATLIAIADQESSFENKRENGGPGGDGNIWTSPPSVFATSGVSDPTPTFPLNPPPAFIGGIEQPPQQKKPSPLEAWKMKFANEAGDGYVTKNYGVGPMQLTDIGLKHEADDRFKLANRDEFMGGRWHPEHNIWVGAHYLRTCLQGTVRDSGRDIDMWMGVMAYNRGIQGALDYFAKNGQISAYGISVKNKVYNDPGYYEGVKGALQAAQEAADAAKDGETDVQSAQSDAPPRGLPTRNQVSAMFASQVLSPANNAIARRERIVGAAMWGYFNAPLMHYSQGSERMHDFAPPPNVPGYTDCSGFATWCYKSAGAPDPNGNGYDGSGYTGTLWNNGRSVTLAQISPGDLVFYSDPSSVHSHVAVYAGFGKVVSFGSEQGPFILPVKYRSDLFGFRTYTV
jgi:prophage tail gpP-like protein/cell wall-associated NlpC family hydrolase